MARQPPHAARLDERDIQILDIIQTNGRISKKALAGRIGLSLTPCFERMRRLEKEGFISSYRGVVDPNRFGPTLRIHTEVTLYRHRPRDFADFESAVRGVSEIVYCDAVGGGVDYVLTFVTRDIVHYQRLMDDLLAGDLHIDRYFTYIVTKRVKDAGIALTSLLPV
jgi:Lrp/AsnC family transcriptional regulator of ectoine degradation